MPSTHKKKTRKGGTVLNKGQVLSPGPNPLQELSPPPPAALPPNANKKPNNVSSPEPLPQNIKKPNNVSSPEPLPQNTKKPNEPAIIP